MDQSLLQRILAKIGVAILAIALVDLLYLNYWVLQSSKVKTESKNLEQSRLVEVKASPTPTPLSSPSLAESGQEQTSAPEKPQPTPVTLTKTIVEKETQTIVQTASREIFIPIGSGSTYSNSYADLAGLEVTIDTTKYPPIESVIFEASIWVQDGNGKMYAQLYAKNEGAVLASEISTSLATANVVTSGKFLLPTGAKTYKVQAKTNLISYAAHVDNARLKIVLK